MSISARETITLIRVSSSVPKPQGRNQIPAQRAELVFRQGPLLVYQGKIMYQSSTDVLWITTLGACRMSLLLTELKAFSNLSFQPSVCRPEETTLCPPRDIPCVLQPASLTYSDPPTMSSFPSQLHHPSYHVKSSDVKLPLRLCLNIPVPYKFIFDPHPQRNFFFKYPFLCVPIFGSSVTSCILFCSYGVLHIPAFLSRLEVL